MQASSGKKNPHSEEEKSHSTLDKYTKLTDEDNIGQREEKLTMIGVNVSQYVYKQCEAIAEMYGISPTGLTRLALMRFIWLNESLLPEVLVPVSHKEKILNRKYGSTSKNHHKALRKYMLERKADHRLILKDRPQHKH